MSLGPPLTHPSVPPAGPPPALPAPLLVVAGPTGVGKSALALRLAEAREGEIVVADALQVYRGMDIGTAKPGPADRARVRHHLLDLRDPDEPFTAADFRRLAWEAIAAIRGRGRLPIVVGGSGFYLRALLRERFGAPPPPPEVRAALQAEAKAAGPEALHRRLARADRAMAARIHPRDRYRVTRALEILAVAPDAPSRLGAGLWEGALRGPLCLCVLSRPPEELEARIEARVDAMLAAGLVEEVRGLLARGYPPGLKPLAAIGYRQVVEHLAGRYPLAEVRRRMVVETRRYAKRQLTWFRREPAAAWIEVAGPGGEEGALARIDAQVGAALAALAPRRGGL